MDSINKFEDFLDRMQGLLDNAKKQGHIIVRVEDLEKTFPELAESEDEKIKKWIINEIKIKHHNLDEENVDFVDKAIAWLEKQGSKDKFIEKELGCIKGYREKAIKRLEELEEQGEQKPQRMISAEAKEAMYDKPAWSEGDESILESVIKDVMASHSNRTVEGFLCKLNWVKSIKGRVQPKQEWSEEDEQHIDSLLKRLDALCRNKFERTRFAISEDIDWLKSLRPQNTYNPYKAVVESIAEMCKHYDKASHSGLRDFYDNVKVKCKDAQEYDSLYPQSRWKPSELQLGCLSDAIEHYNSLGYPAPKLKELLDDLKKLKEGKV